jgi:hypothetical protein
MMAACQTTIPAQMAGASSSTGRRARLHAQRTVSGDGAPGNPLAGAQIYAVNRFTLGAVIGAHGGIPEPHRHR